MTTYQGTLPYGSGSIVAYRKYASASNLFPDSLVRIASAPVGIDGSYSLPLTRAGEYVIRIRTVAAAYPDFTVTATNGRTVAELTGVPTPVLRNTPTVPQTGSTGGGGGGGATVLPKTALLNVQNSDGSWDVSAAGIAAARSAGYRVYWVTDATANKAPAVVDGLANGDVVNGAPSLGNVAPAPTSVTIAAGQVPTATDTADTANDKVNLTRVTGVTWTVDGVDHPSSAFTGSTKAVAYTKGTNTTVTAKPESTAYEITNQTRSWTLTFTNVPAPAGGSVIFEDDFGTTALTQAALLARTPSQGAGTYDVGGTGSVTVNSSGQLVIDATAAATSFIINSAAGTTGKFTMTVAAFSGNIGTNTVEMRMRPGANDNRAMGRINPNSGGTYFSQVMVSYSSDTSATRTRQVAYPAQFTTTTEVVGGNVTTTIAENGTNAVSHSKPTYASSTNQVRVHVPAGGVLTINDIKLETV